MAQSSKAVLRASIRFFFFFNDTATTEIYTLSLHDALPISLLREGDDTLAAGRPLLGVPELGRAGSRAQPCVARGSNHRAFRAASFVHRFGPCMSIYLLQTINGIGIGMLYFLLAVGLSIVFGLLRFVNFAHGAFYLLGAYFCYQMTRWGMSFWLSLVVVPLAVGALGWLVEKLMLRHVYAKAHEFHIIVTVGLALVVQELVIVQWGPLGDSVAVPDLLQGVVMWGSFVYPKYRLFVIGFTAVLAVLLWWLLEGTRRSEE